MERVPSASCPLSGCLRAVSWSLAVKKYPEMWIWTRDPLVLKNCEASLTVYYLTRYYEERHSKPASQSAPKGRTCPRALSLATYFLSGACPQARYFSNGLSATDPHLQKVRWTECLQRRSARAHVEEMMPAVNQRRNRKGRPQRIGTKV